MCLMTWISTSLVSVPVVPVFVRCMAARDLPALSVQGLADRHRVDRKNPSSPTLHVRLLCHS
ncbi:hypothetical protein D3C87_1125780 [compost metagenome]